ncbi:TatD-related deoxyribonuclease [gamma proteobacterium HdN1]|nr:TatD-related deoxyribonuclease [gamma proteobacterium HdN1]
MSSKLKPIPQFGKPIIETHCHLDYLKAKPLHELLTDAQSIGVERIVTIGVSPDNQEAVLALTQEHEMVWGTQGIHPHDARLLNDEIAALIQENLHHKKIVAVGEIGLDYYYEHSDRRIQQQVFETQLQWAVDRGLPVVIHTRDADEDTRAILANFSKTLTQRGVIHSFTSGLALAEFCLEEGFCLGFNGITTFNKADNVREVVAITPLDRLLLETDAPFLTPVPYRGRENAPCYLPFIAQTLANVKAIEVEQILDACYQNSMQLFFKDVALL